ncbi:hypothetical protein QYE76_055465 [Lolium multiflorum]|uniref:DUF223 domain-containing protein n=1 Tax=Lolium multiflorum TaxID=4521 RepID=A0AAD8SZR5_LOLMU|nr:hypothetical protein QYE76_055465 [Lolium multiflorum]
MGSAEDEFTPLSQLTDETGKCKVRVRISRLWESFNPKNNILFGLDSLLIDDQGETMQARVLPNDIELFEERLVEGKVYALSDFTVQETRESYMSCSNYWTIYFRRKTVVNEIEGDIDSIPLHSFEFVNFKDLHSRRDNNSLVTDVLGHIVHVGKLQKFKKKSRHIQTCDAAIRNLRYKLKAKVRDNTGRMNLMIFCEVAEKLVGVSAEKLVDEIKEDDDWYTLPKKIADLLGSTHTFQVFDKYGNGSFSVWWIMDHVSVPVAVATTGQCTVEPVLEDNVNMADPSPTTTQGRVNPVREGGVTTVQARPKSTRLSKPNKRLRGDDWIN